LSFGIYLLFDACYLGFIDIFLDRIMIMCLSKNTEDQKT
jgi:hypothetical protein